MLQVHFQIGVNLSILIVRDQDLSFCVGLKALFTNNNASEEEKALGKAP